ncbi:type II toxin-antitoxin system VapC family toxin [Aquamicrobium sp. LC103]|uniref:type II toxin-antitoxin system VapC family toxin n=1 Tax=Aquamicrobium sp. LC103 TaxID=1120658 RepID=UPI00063EC355|nr:type II toxin-antitoxin system VapC family toxin [Aquamicrobium sp. LC103]TKT81414.1 type II toxin-antitoxin system VapC family toxin [Aquamicrobium sp. LC103]
MFVDASALTAMLTNEEDARELLSRLQRSKVRMTSPLAVWETTIAVARILGLPTGEVAEEIEKYLALMDIELVAVPPQTWKTAVDAFERFGKGRHPAQLNFGDCFAYACARQFDQPLMFKGGDFTKTDIEAG